MNELSWLIYAADVAGSLKGIGWTAAIGGVFVALGTSAVAAMLKGEGEDEIAARVWRWAKGAMVVVGVSIIPVVIVPSSNTLYAIAASEMGEHVIASETGGKAVEALNAWLDRQIGKKEPA